MITASIRDIFKMNNIDKSDIMFYSYPQGLTNIDKELHGVYRIHLSSIEDAIYYVCYYWYDKSVYYCYLKIEVKDGKAGKTKVSRLTYREYILHLRSKWIDNLDVLYEIPHSLTSPLYSIEELLYTSLVLSGGSRDNQLKICNENSYMFPSRISIFKIPDGTLRIYGISNEYDIKEFLHELSRGAYNGKYHKLDRDIPQSLIDRLKSEYVRRHL